MFSKYRAKKTVVDGKKFDSKKEADRYKELKLLLQAGKITELRCQITFPLTAHGIKICSYRSDFVYKINGKMHVEDVKGFRTPIYKLKKKLFEANYPWLKIEEK